MTKRDHSVAVVGLGFGRAHIPAFQAHGCRVVAVAQRDEASARKVAETYGVPGVYTRWEAMLEQARPDIVVIATPPHLHRDIALAAFAGGAHVLCEKPIAMSREEAEAMVAAGARARRVAMTGFNWRFPAAMQRLHALVEQGALGRVFHLSARWLGARWADAAAATTWRMDRTVAGHGAMGDMGVHLVDLVRWHFGDFARVATHAGVAYPDKTAPTSGRPADTEDHASILGVLASGAAVTLTASRAAHGRNEHSLEVYGERGALAYRLDRAAPRWYDGELSATDDKGVFQRVDAARPGEAVTGDPMDVLGKTTIAPLVERMLQAIETGAPASPSLEDGLRAQAVLEAVRESAARGAWVDVR
jgi:predicted dehydrogenase